MLEMLDNVPMWKLHGANEPEVSPQTTHAERLWNPFIFKSTFIFFFFHICIYPICHFKLFPKFQNQSKSQPDDFKPTEAPLAPNNEAAEARFDSAPVSGCLNYKGESVPYVINRFQ